MALQNFMSSRLDIDLREIDHWMDLITLKEWEFVRAAVGDIVYDVKRVDGASYTLTVYRGNDVFPISEFAFSIAGELWKHMGRITPERNWRIMGMA